MLGIDSSDDDETEKVKTAIESTMLKEYEVIVPSNLNLRFKLTDKGFSYTRGELLDKLRCQNPILNYITFEVGRLYTASKRGKLSKLIVNLSLRFWRWLDCALAGRNTEKCNRISRW